MPKRLKDFARHQEFWLAIVFVVLFVGLSILLAALASVGSAGGSAIDAGWLGAGKVKATISRIATVAELAFATGTGTVAQPGDLGWEGAVNIQDIGNMWNL